MVRKSGDLHEIQSEGGRFRSSVYSSQPLKVAQKTRIDLLPTIIRRAEFDVHLSASKTRVSERDASERLTVACAEQLSLPDTQLCVLTLTAVNDQSRQDMLFSGRNGGPTMATTKKSADTQDLLGRMNEMEMTFLAPMGAFGMAMANAWLDLYEEWAGFTTRRLRRDVRAANAMMHCKSPTEMPKIQAAFFQQALEEYQEEASRVSTVLQDASRKFSLGDAQDSA